MAVFTVGLSADVANDRACLDRLASIDASFTSASSGLRHHTVCNIILLSGCAARGVMSETVNGNRRLWVYDLMRSPQQVHSSTVLPQSNAVFNAPPAPAFTRTRSFCTTGGDVLELVEGPHIPREIARPGKRASRCAGSFLPQVSTGFPTASWCIVMEMPTHLPYVCDQCSVALFYVLHV